MSTRPCREEHPEPRPDLCRPCWLAVHVRAYQRKWGLPQTGELETVNSSPPRSHTHHAGGPGTELKALFTELVIHEKPDCGCGSLVRQMDAWGPAGCRERLAEILARLREGQGHYGWREKAVAAVRALASGLAFRLDPLDPFPGLVEEAIRRAEARGWG